MNGARPLVAALAILLVAIVTGAMLATWQAVRATNAEQLAQSRLM